MRAIARGKFQVQDGDAHMPNRAAILFRRLRVLGGGRASSRARPASVPRLGVKLNVPRRKGRRGGKGAETFPSKLRTAEATAQIPLVAEAGRSAACQLSPPDIVMAFKDIHHGEQFI